MKKRIITRIIFCILIFSTSRVYSQQQEEFIQYSSGNAINDSTTIVVIDDKFLDSLEWLKIDTTYSVENKIYFEINPDTNVVLAVPFNCSIDLEIKKWDADNNLTIEYPTLHVNYDTLAGSVFIRKSYFITSGSHKVEVNVQHH